MSALYTAKDIASLFVQIANNLPDNQVDNLKLNKLCYYAQGWHLARHGTPLFDDEIQAWQYGPVVPSVYQAYKICGGNPIEAPASDFDDLAMTLEDRDLIADVYICYGKYTSVGLKDLTHRRGTPWDKVYVQGVNNVITQRAMKEYFENSSEMQWPQFIFSDENVSFGLAQEE